MATCGQYSLHNQAAYELSRIVGYLLPQSCGHTVSPTWESESERIKAMRVPRSFLITSPGKLSLPNKVSEGIGELAGGPCGPKLSDNFPEGGGL